MERKLKVRYLDGNAKYVGVKLQGKWLEDMGYSLNDKIIVTVDSNTIIIKKESMTPGGGK